MRETEANEAQRGGDVDFGSVIASFWHCESSHRRVGSGRTPRLPNPFGLLPAAANLSGPVRRRRIDGIEIGVDFYEARHYAKSSIPIQPSGPPQGRLHVD